MKLSELINKAQKAKEKHGNMEVMSMVYYNEDCGKCGQSGSHNKSGIVDHVFATDDGVKFWINGFEE